MDVKRLGGRTILTERATTAVATRLAFLAIGLVFLGVGAFSGYRAWHRGFDLLPTFMILLVGLIAAVAPYWMGRNDIVIDSARREIHITRTSLQGVKRERYGFDEIHDVDRQTSEGSAFVRLRLRSGGTVLLTNYGIALDRTDSLMESIREALGLEQPLG